MKTGPKPMDGAEELPGDKHFDAIVAARRLAESTICVAMITSSIPGLEVTYLAGEDGDEEVPRQ